MNLKFSSEIMNDALFRAHELTDGSSDFDAQALVYMNRGYRAIYMGGAEFDSKFKEDWWWLKSEGSIILQPTIKTGTVNLTKDSSSITFSASIATDVAGYYFKADNHADVFVVSVHGGATDAATLDTVYTGDTDTTASYRLMKLNYDITSAIKLIAPMQGYQDRQFKIEGISLDSLERDYPLGDIHAGIPSKFAMVDEDTVRFSHYGDDNGGLIRVDYDALTLPADLTDSGAEEPLIPLQYRHILSDATLFFLLTDKSEQLAPAMGLLTKSGIMSMAKENRNRWAHMGQPGMIYPRQTGRGNARRVLRTESGNIIS